MSATGPLRLPRTEQSARVRRLSQVEGPASARAPRSVLLEEGTAQVRHRLHALVCDELARGAPGITTRAARATPCPPR